ncbi:hypothetical protein PPL_10983 [Heterostelium album PN500]|uniref:Uncharacterized protein n=1 Tax=Heterostelium pallidum (strain ATCC 26659 / Pp 5 / PN500) TaxID=670386 RepID=D3BSL4_HETP5|nr:hypothetical protein PPL_10983 [Heterostelium album PN500]EFA75479.1 hypothetical protein PPL_10983 [Heterostelium album PN500]|eukprot:XP_020427613.1 hypothetical protein PPL_10983 [Heterostelium album PN500]
MVNVTSIHYYRLFQQVFLTLIVGSTDLGQFPVSVYQVELGSFNQSLLVDPKTCSLVSNTITSTDPNNQLYALEILFNNVNTFEETMFTLPPACTSLHLKTLSLSSLPDKYKIPLI